VKEILRKDSTLEEQAVKARLKDFGLKKHLRQRVKDESTIGLLLCKDRENDQWILRVN